MNITKEHIASKKVIGKLKGKQVHEVVTTGGLHLVVTQDGGKIKTLGAGPHRAVARYIAEKNEPDFLCTELSKSDALDLVFLEAALPEFIELTDRIRALESR